MPLRGESVGTAYVQIRADGNRVPDDIRDAFNDADRVYDDAGRVGAKRYKKTFGEELESHTGRSLSDSFFDALAKNDVTERYFQSEDWKRFERNVHARFGNVGEDAAKQLQNEFLKKGNLDGIENAVGNMVARINSDIDQSYTDIDTHRRGTFKNLDNDVKKTEHLGIRLAQTIDRIGDGVGRAFGKGSRSEFLNFTGSFIGNSVKLLGVFPRLLGNLGEFKDGFSATLKEGNGFFKAISGGFTRMSQDAEGSATAMSSLVATGVAALPALVVALLGVVAVLSIVASLISGIVAAIIAMASTISFAIVGAIVPLLGLIAPLGLALAGIIGLIVGITKSTKDLKKFVTPVFDELTKIAKGMADVFFNNLNVSVKDFTDSLKNLAPLGDAIAKSFAEVVNQFNAWFTSPFMDRFLKRMSNFVPFVIGRLSDALGAFGDAMLRIFLLSIPYAKHFLNWLVQIARKFDEFVKKNPDKIRQFFNDAAESARTIWKFLGAVGRVLGDLLFSSSGKKAGDTIFGDLTKQLDKFDKFLDKHPKALQEFFANGVQVARDLGNIAKSLADIFSTLDSPEGRQSLHFILRLVAGLALLANVPGVAATSMLSWILRNAPRLKSAAEHVADALDHAREAIGRFFGRLGSVGNGRALSIDPRGLVSWIPGVAARIQGFFGRVRDGAANVRDNLGQMFSNAGDRIRSAMSTAADRVVSFIRSIPGRLGGLAGEFGNQARVWVATIQSIVSDLPGNIVDMFRGLAGRILDAIGSINIVPHIDWPSPPGWLSKLHIPGTAVGGVFDQAAMRIIGEAGPEAVVPLNRPLDQVDPSVRWLSAIAQGLAPPPGTPGSGASSAGKVINNEWHITPNTADPSAVAAELLNRMVASAY